MMQVVSIIMVDCVENPDDLFLLSAIYRRGSL